MNDPVEIPVATDQPLYQERVTLDGKEYVIQLDWNDRESRWYLSLFDIEETALVTGIKVIPNWPLLRRFANESLPPGVLMAVDLSPGPGESPGYVDLGQRVKLHYFPNG